MPVKHVLSLHINNMKHKAGAAGTPAVELDRIVEDVTRMREIYAQIGVDVWYSNGLIGDGQVPNVTPVDPPPGPDSTSTTVATL